VSRREQYLAALGVEVWTLRARGPGARIVPDGQSVSTGQGVAGGAPIADGADAAAWEALEALRAQVAGCTRCGLCQSRTQTVFGVGKRRAGLLVIGEAPGAEEDRQGEPFVGRAGQLLNSMLRAVGQPRENVYIANVLKCRPPGNRDPAPAEVASCLPYLQRQIELLAPRVILVVGRIAAQNLLGTTETIGRLRGRVHGLGAHGTPLIVTYHPAYLLRSPLEKRRAWSDLKLARAAMREAGM
jgi:DNA polymerase